MNEIKKIQSILTRENIDAWMIIQDENKDPYFSKFFVPNTSALSIAIITQTSYIIFAHSLEKELIENYIKEANIKVYSTEGNNTIENLLNNFITQHSLKIIALNYTTMNDVKIDTLGYGYYKYYTSLILEKTNVSFVSSENIIYGLIDSKSYADIEKMSLAAKRALWILMKAFSEVKVGMSEKELVELVHIITEDSRQQFIKENALVEETYSWEEELCPIVLTGKSFLKGGHAISSDTLIEKGNTLYFDFGVTLTFQDGSKWSSDIQRTAYVLKDEETVPPQYIVERFEDIIQSITLGMEALNIGIEGYKINEKVRGYLLSKGYPDYDHSTGHAIGENTHNPGANFTKGKTGLLKVQPNGVYTIEPRIPLENGVSIEEMVVVYDDGSVATLCDRQLEIILI